MTFRFRNRFRLFGVLLGVDASKFVLAEPETMGELITLVSTEPKSLISAGEQLALEGTGYTTKEDAIEAALRWRQYLVDAFASQAIPIEFGDSVTSSYSTTTSVEYNAENTRPFEHTQSDEPSGLLVQLGIKIGDRIVFDDDRLLIFDTDPEPRLMYADGHAPVLRFSPEGIQERLNTLTGREWKLWPPNVALSYKLVHSSLRDSNPETRFIQLVTAIEALLPGANRPDEEMSALAELEESVAFNEKWSPETKKRMQDMLASAHKMSVAREARSLLLEYEGVYEGKTAADFFADCYTLRSDLVHGGSLPFDGGQYGRIYAELLLLVRRVLDRQ